MLVARTIEAASLLELRRNRRTTHLHKSGHKMARVHSAWTEVSKRKIHENPKEPRSRQSKHHKTPNLDTFPRWRIGGRLRTLERRMRAIYPPKKKESKSKSTQKHSQPSSFIRVGNNSHFAPPPASRLSQILIIVTSSTRWSLR